MKKEITIQEAISLLPNKPEIHTFEVILGNNHFWGGCNVSKERAVEIIRTSQNVYLDTGKSHWTDEVLAQLKG